MTSADCVFWMQNCQEDNFFCESVLSGNNKARFLFQHKGQQPFLFVENRVTFWQQYFMIVLSCPNVMTLSIWAVRYRLIA